MQVIGAGFGRTGTLSLKAALEILGFSPCYHMTELMKNPSHAAFWQGAVEATERGEAVLWDELFAQYKATVDWPGCVFYEELAREYPGAKVILTERDPEGWYESARRTVGRGWESPERNTSTSFRLFRRLIPGANRQIKAVEGVMHRRSFGKSSIADGITREEATGAFVRHGREVRLRIPDNRLLVYSVKDGWGPLCDFLGVAYPNRPFPHINDREGFGKMVARNLALGLAKTLGPFVGAVASVLVVLGLILLARRRPPETR